MTGMADGPPTVACPGCGASIEVEHLTVTDLAGRRYYIASQTEHQALLGHVDLCRNVEHDTPS